MPKKPTIVENKLDPDLIQDARMETDKTKKLTKKEARVADMQLRDGFGDTAGKEDHIKISDGPKVKDDYEAFEKRPYDRHSGTGRPVFKKNNFKKGGYGKGNVGTLAKGEFVDEDMMEEEIEGLEDAVNIPAETGPGNMGEVNTGTSDNQTQNVRVVGDEEFNQYKNAHNNDLGTDLKNIPQTTDNSRINNDITNLQNNETEFPSLS